MSTEPRILGMKPERFILNSFMVIGGVALMRKLGIIDFGASKKFYELDALNPNYWYTETKARPTMTEAEKMRQYFGSRTYEAGIAFYKTLATQIYFSKGIVWDNEAQAVAALKLCQSRVQLSMLAYSFRGMYKQDLAVYLASFLEKKNEEDLYKWSKGLPKWVN